MDEISVLQTYKTNFREEEIQDAEALLYKSLSMEDRMQVRRTDKGESSLQDFIKVLKETEPDDVPTFVAKQLNKLPHITFDHVDVTRLLKDMTTLKVSLEEMKCRMEESESTIILLALTGLLWGCTNPFIKRGTTGLRDVKANSLLGQLYAEVAFLVTNWRYVVPFCVNQLGSVSYILAVQRAPLSLAVPAANGLAFAATAVTGAAVGLEPPLQTSSILGIALIAAGTALCCWDKT